MADPFEALPTEIKQTIFVLAQKKLLSSTLLVSKSWYAQTIPLIWREVTLRSIWCIRTSQNAHLYLSLIHSLVFGLKDNRDYHDDIIQVFKKPHLPNLEKISYVPGVLFANDSIDYIISYLQPTLLSFYSIGGGLSLKLLSAVKETCTRLEDLRIKLPSDNITNEMSKDDFHNWLQIPSLRALSVFSKGSIDAPLVDDIMDQLLSKSTLQELLKRPFRRLCLEYRVDNLDELYTDSIRHTLRELSIVVRPSVIPGLRDLGRLQKLQLRVDGGSEGVISSLCSLVDLKSLKIIFTKATILQVDHVMELKHLAKLEELEIRTGPGEIFRGRVGPPPPIKILPFFDEEYFDQLASSLPKLRHVCLLFDWEPKSCHILKSAAFLWPEIEFLCLGNNIDIHESSLPSMTGKHMFPYLRKLKTRFLFTDVTGQYDYDQPDDDGLALNRYANKIVKNLSDAFPVLEGIKFCSSSDPDLRNAITNCISAPRQHQPSNVTASTSHCVSLVFLLSRTMRRPCSVITLVHPPSTTVSPFQQHRVEMDGFNSTQLQSLQSKDQAALLDTVDEIRRHGVNRYVSLPQIIVCGDQSSGKSSVLEAISGVQFPVNDGLCTRFTTEVILRRASENMAVVKLIPSKDATPDHKGKLDNFRKTSISHAEIPNLISEAKTIMGLTGNSTFSRDILQLEVSGPKLPHLTLVDLPGLIHHPNREQTEEDVRIPRDLVKQYMSQPRSIVLAIVTAKNDTSNQVVLEMAKTADSQGVRTMGIITKPDCLIKDSPNENAFFNLANNKETYFKLGWHVLRNGDFNERKNSSFDRDEMEKKFFSSGIWKSLQPSRRGVDTLRTRLSHVLCEQIQRELPTLLKEIENELADCKATLNRLGSARDTPSHQRVYLTAMAERFQELVWAGCEGIYQHPFFRLENLESKDLGDQKKPSMRLRANVRKAEQKFLDTMQKNGHTYHLLESTEPVKFKFGEDEQYISEQIFLQEIRDLLNDSKGKELPGTFTPLLVGDLFVRQSRNWKNIAIEFVEGVWDLTKQFLDDVLAHVADESVRQTVLEQVVDPAMEKSLSRLKEKVIELHSPYARGYPATLNPRFVQELENKKQAHQAATQQAQQSSESGAPQDDPDDPDAHACRELLYLMQAYYAIALDVFVDNVSSLGVENCLMIGLRDLLSPRMVSEMDDETLGEIASESEDVRELRSQTVEKQASLQKSFELCRRQARKLSLTHDNNNGDAPDPKNPKPFSPTGGITEQLSKTNISTKVPPPEQGSNGSHPPTINSSSTSAAFGNTTPSSKPFVAAEPFKATSPAPTTTSSGFGSTSSFGGGFKFSSPAPATTSGGFGSTSGFLAPTTSLFGSPSPVPDPFGTTSGTAFNKSPSPAPKSASSPFGSSPSSQLPFGQTSWSQGKGKADYSDIPVSFYLKDRTPIYQDTLRPLQPYLGDKHTDPVDHKDGFICHISGISRNVGCIYNYCDYSPEEIRLKDYKHLGILS